MTKPVTQPPAENVKALEWVRSGNDYGASSVAGEYEILKTPEAWTVFRNGQGLSRHNHDLEAAKAAAQADYERRIRSALAQQPLSVPTGWQQALDKPFCVLYLDGRNEHGSHVLSSFPRSFDPAETNIEDEAETILAEAEALGFSIGDHVWAEFDWIAPQIDNEGRTELTGYWEFKRIDPKMTAALPKPEGARA